MTVLLSVLAAISVVVVDAQLAWWQTTVIYQIYPRSCKDSDSSGVGDINGISSKLSLFPDTGIDSVWISPVYPSPMKDNGYDVSDFIGIDPTFGTMADFDNLLATAHQSGLKVIMDYIPNHTSDMHPWFAKASNSSDPEFDKYKDFFVWTDRGRDADGNPVIPNNWERPLKPNVLYTDYSPLIAIPQSWFGGPAWTWHEGRQKFYFHQFGSYQPDLNFSNPQVVEEMKDVLRFWLNKGVDGFRMDAVPHLFEADGFPDEEFQGQYLKHDPRTYDMIKQWRALLDSINNQAVMMTESYGSFEEIAGYYGDAQNPGAHFSFNFQLVYADASKSAADLKNDIDAWNNFAIPRGLPNNWLLGNHDKPRVGSRFNENLVDGLNMLLLLLPGTAITYYGEEIGMLDNYNITYNPGETPGERDPQRTPYQWDSTANAGFSEAQSTWLPVHSNYQTVNLESERTDNQSHYKVYQSLLQARKLKVVQEGDVSTAAIFNVIIVIRKLQTECIISAVNLDDSQLTFSMVEVADQIPQLMNVYSASVGSDKVIGEPLDTTYISLKSYEAIVLANI